MTPPNLSLILIMVCFWVTLWLVSRFLIRPVGGMVTERRRRIDDAQQEWATRNEEHRVAVARVEDEFQQAAREAAKHRADQRQQAMEQRNLALESARARADERLASVLESLEKDSEAVRGELRRRAEELARILAGRLLGREMSS